MLSLTVRPCECSHGKNALHFNLSIQQLLIARGWAIHSAPCTSIYKFNFIRDKWFGSDSILLLLLWSQQLRAHTHASDLHQTLDARYFTRAFAIYTNHHQLTFFFLSSAHSGDKWYHRRQPKRIQFGSRAIFIAHVIRGYFFWHSCAKCKFFFRPPLCSSLYRNSIANRIHINHEN